MKNLQVLSLILNPPDVAQPEGCKKWCLHGGTCCLGNISFFIPVVSQFFWHKVGSFLGWNEQSAPSRERPLEN